MNVNMTDLDVLLALVPIPGLDRHIITSRQHDASRRVHRQATNIIWACLERRDLLMRVVVDYAKLEVVRARDEPV